MHSNHHGYMKVCLENQKLNSISVAYLDCNKFIYFLFCLTTVYYMCGCSFGLVTNIFY